MKSIKADLLTDVVSSYDQTKTTIQGRVAQKTLSGLPCLGPPLTKFIDVFSDSAQTVSGAIRATDNNRLFVCGTPAAGLLSIMLYDFTLATGSFSYIGRIIVTLPNTATTAHTIRSLLIVNDSGLTGWKLYLTTVGSVTYNGGNFLINSIDKADFIPTGTAIPTATGNNQKAVYKVHDLNTTFSTVCTVTVASPGKVQFTAHPFYVNDPVIFIYGTLPTGLSLNTTYFVRNPSANDFELSATSGGASINTIGLAGSAAISGVYNQTAMAGTSLDDTNNKLYCHNGVAATHQFYVLDTSVSPTYSNVSSLVISDVTDDVTYTNHPFQNNDPILLTNLVGGTGLTNNTVYFVRNATQNTFQLSATSGGAAINITVAGTATVGRAFGITTAGFSYKTANMPALSGTLLATDSEEYAVPVSAPINGGVLNGNPCVFLATTTTLYLGLLSQITAGATTWASLTSSNVLGTANQVTTPTPTFATWSTTLDTAIFVTNTSKFITKKVENNVIGSITGELVNTYYEGFSFTTAPLGLASIVALTIRDGWIFAAGGTVGQRGILVSDFNSDASIDYSYVVTKVLNNPNSALKFFTTWEPLWSDTGNVKLQYRTSGFGSISGGWLDIDNFTDLSSAVIGSNQIQFKILFRMQSEGSSSPAQVNELLIGIEENNAIDDHFEFSDDFSDNTSPSRCTFRLKLAFDTSVPTLYFRAYDLSDALLVNHNTVTNAANFEYSTDNGNTFLPLGTIPNTVGTLVRYTFTSPPGVDIRPGIKTS